MLLNSDLLKWTKRHIYLHYVVFWVFQIYQNKSNDHYGSIISMNNIFMSQSSPFPYFQFCAYCHLERLRMVRSSLCLPAQSKSGQNPAQSRQTANLQQRIAIWTSASCVNLHQLALHFTQCERIDFEIKLTHAHYCTWAVKVTFSGAVSFSHFLKGVPSPVTKVCRAA